MPPPERWDIFCTVVDNFGDIGVAWRLARQLVAEHGLQVRLWVDDLASFQRLAPEVDPGRPAQSCRGVEVRHWAELFPETEPAEVVIEAFACRLPERYLAAMAAKTPAPLWLNLEYLSAEDWVKGCHGLASPHPSLPLTRYFFFPGVTAGTGGLLMERGLAERRRAFQQDPGARAAFWQSLGLPAPGPGEPQISLFCYENEAVPGLLRAWSLAPSPIRCLVPEGRVIPAVAAFFGRGSAAPGDCLRAGSLTIRVLPFVEQDRYDRLLWACDCNFVRGEDSFVRAQWAAKPLVWHIYPQEDGAHWKKLDAFLDIYCAGLPGETAAAMRALWTAWNRGQGAGAAWGDFWRQRAELEAHARSWADQLPQGGDLASNLVHFCQDRLK
jgi:uncharacterized repeat protein (TIGR03837 family)